MRLLAVLMVLVFVSAAGFAEDKKPGETPQTVTETGKVKQKERKESSDVQNKKRVPWPRPYQPSEKIRADSIVPFPADI